VILASFEQKKEKPLEDRITTGDVVAAASSTIPSRRDLKKKSGAEGRGMGVQHTVKYQPKKIC